MERGGLRALGMVAQLKKKIRVAIDKKFLITIQMSLILDLIFCNIAKRKKIMKFYKSSVVKPGT